MSRSEFRVSETTTGDPRIGSPVCKEITYGGLVFEATRYISANYAVLDNREAYGDGLPFVGGRGGCENPCGGYADARSND